MLKASYHNHSCWSDGHNTIREMAIAAREAGVEEFGISDHLVLSPEAFGEQRLWSMLPQDFPRYVADALAVKAELETPDFQIRVGVEVDYFTETTDALKAMLDSQPLDYVIGAAHFAASQFPIDHDMREWKRLTPEQCQVVWRKYLEKMIGICQAGYANFIAHIDLPKKYGFFMPEELWPQLDGVLQAVAATGLPLELNTAGRDKPCQEFYPSDKALNRAVELGIPFVVSCDAHDVSQVTRYFDDAYRILAAAGAKTGYRFQKRKLIPPADNA